MALSQPGLDELPDYYLKTAANIISYYECDERKDKLKELREIVKTNCLQEKKLKHAEEVKERLAGLYELDGPGTDMDVVIKEYVDAVNNMSTNVSKVKSLKEFDKQVEALLHDKEGNEGDSEDDDLQLKGGYVNVIDPISKKRIVDPVKNSVCGHTYDRQTIMEVLKINKNTRCPVVGCKSKDYVILSNLKADIVTQTYLDQHPE